MKTIPVTVTCDVTAKVLAQPFRYRVYVNNELFTERTWIWTDSYLEEMLPISALAGVYPIRFETVDPDNGRIKVRNYRTDIESLQDSIAELEVELIELNKDHADAETVKRLVDHIEQEKQRLALYKQTRPARIIMYRGETSVEISNESQ